MNRRNGGGLLGYAAADDVNGIGPSPGGDADRGVTRNALAMGLNLAYNLNTTFKVEYRMDRASGAVFRDAGDGSYRRTNQLFGTAVVVSF